MLLVRVIVTQQIMRCQNSSKKRLLIIHLTPRKFGEVSTSLKKLVRLVQTFFTLLKGFVATGVLFLPKGWRNGGWLFSSLALVASCILTIITSLKLLEIRQKYKLSYSEIGRKAYGLPGKVAVDFFLAFTQTIFVCAYITFIVDSVNNIISKTFDQPEINQWILGGVCFIIYVPLCWVRKIEKFAFFHVVADISIVIGLTVITVYASIELNDNGFSHDEEFINTKTFLSFIGLAAYTFEGIGIIIPVMETTSRPDLYPMILILVITIITASMWRSSLIFSFKPVLSFLVFLWLQYR